MSTDRLTEAAALLAGLARCRQRLIMVGFVRLACASTAAALFALEAFLFVWRPTAVHAAHAAALLMAAAIVTAAIAAAVRAPSLGRTAALLDRKGRLEDRAITAIQVREQRDAVARLVVRDAVARLAGLVPSDVFPLEAPPHMGAVVAILAAAPVLFILAGTGPPRDERTNDAFEPAATSIGTGHTAAGTRIVPDRRAPNGSAFTRMTVPPGTKPASRSSSGTLPSATQPGSETTTDGQQPVVRPDPKGGGTSQGVAAPRADGAPSGGGLGAASGSGGLPTAIAASGGGVKGSALTDVSPAPSSGLPKNASTAGYRTAWSRAQAAIPRDRVPADHRAHVKNYFVAIRPQERER